MKFIPTADTRVSNSTSNINHLLSNTERQSMRVIINPDIMRWTFGAGDDSCYIPSKGYTDPEWYFKGECGVVMGIGFRHGIPRIRGKNTNDQEMTSYEIADAFIGYVYNQINLRLGRVR